MKQDNALQVYYDEKLVGTLVMTANRKAAFQYTDEWLEHGFSISPFSLPLKKQVFVPQRIILAAFMACLRTVFRIIGEDCC